MKSNFYLFLLILLFFSCSTEEAKKTSTVEQKAETIIPDDGLQKSYYPKGNLKMSGKLNAQGLKEGVWTSYFENGQKNSESTFVNGINNGYSMVWFPSGKVRYFGDYKGGKQVGEWTYFNEEGKIIEKQSH
ncbi:MAG: toxin-antitoxin system YwqK family antitoxin [Crocinitomicaceae bacterium]